MLMNSRALASPDSVSGGKADSVIRTWGNAWSFVRFLCGLHALEERFASHPELVRLQSIGGMGYRIAHQHAYRDDLDAGRAQAPAGCYQRRGPDPREGVQDRLWLHFSDQLLY